MGIDPFASEQFHEESTIKAAFASIIDIFRSCLVVQFGEPEACRKLPIVAGALFPFEQQSEPFGRGEMFGFAVGNEFAEGLCHAGQAHGIQFIECWMSKRLSFSLVVIAGSADVGVVDRFMRRRTL